MSAKVVLCISPHFPPINAADMHRLRQSLSYFEEFGWKPVVFAVAPQYVEQAKDPLLESSIPENVEIIWLEAFSTSWTRKLGLGNLGIRSWLQYRNAINKYIKKNKVDLVYFTTTVFTLMSLGPQWKKKFNIPFVVDIQDPWRNDYYLSIPKSERPKKFWFDYLQKKHLEAYTMPKANGIVSVSEAYVDTMKNRYRDLREMACLTIPFGALEKDIDIAKQAKSIALNNQYTNIVYIGRGGKDMAFSLSAMFNAFKTGLDEQIEGFEKIRFHFFGTSYAANGKGEQTILPVAKKYGIEPYVNEKTDRLPYFESLSTLNNADILFVPGSIDEKYTASKIFPYIMLKKPLIAVFNEKSSVVDIILSQNDREIVTFRSENSIEETSDKVLLLLKKIVQKLPFSTEINGEAFKPYTAREMTKKQCTYFDQIIDNRG